MPRSRHSALFALITAAALTLTGCADPAEPGASTTEGEATGKTPTKDVVSAVKKADAVAELLPEEVQKAGTLRIAAATGSPPGAFYEEDGTTLSGADVDFADAVAKVLGVELKREVASFEAILPALGSGKYDLGTGNFGVTDERRKTIDFVTYINDGQGFAVREDSKLKEITDLTDLCGLNVSTGAGTTFEVALQENLPRCAEKGKKPYEVKTYADPAAVWLSLKQKRTDVNMSTINGLRYAVTQQEGLRFLNEYKRLDVGFAFKKGSPLTPAFQAAVNQLKKDGTYDRILKKWGTTESAIEESQISPPELKGPEPK